MYIIEIKARSDQNDSIRAILVERNARFVGTDHQIDTYFNSKTGRLKLREGKIENTLIYYQRANQSGPKKSKVVLIKNPDSGIKDILLQSNEVLVVVDKKREIYFIDHIKFHLDKVEGLGEFVEIEVINEKEDIEEDDLQSTCEYYLKLFNIPEQNMVSVSYSDLLLNMTI